MTDLMFCSHVLRCVGESGAVLRGGVLWTVRRHVAQDHHDGPVRIHPLGHAEVVGAVVGNDVCQVVLRSEQTLSIRRSASDRRLGAFLGLCPLLTWCVSNKMPKLYCIKTILCLKN